MEPTQQMIIPAQTQDTNDSVIAFQKKAATIYVIVGLSAIVIGTLILMQKLNKK